jgi:hypothetical protein
MNEYEKTKLDALELEKQIQADEEWFRRELDTAKMMIGDMPVNKMKTKNQSYPADPEIRNYANGYGQKVTHDTTRLGNLMNYDGEEFEPRRKGVRGLIILATLEILGILGVVAYWMLVLLK